MGVGDPPGLPLEAADVFFYKPNLLYLHHFIPLSDCKKESPEAIASGLSSV